MIFFCRLAQMICCVSPVRPVDRDHRFSDIGLAIPITSPYEWLWTPTQSAHTNDIRIQIGICSYLKEYYDLANCENPPALIFSVSKWCPWDINFPNYNFQMSDMKYLVRVGLVRALPCAPNTCVNRIFKSTRIFWARSRKKQRDDFWDCDFYPFDKWIGTFSST